MTERSCTTYREYKVQRVKCCIYNKIYNNTFNEGVRGGAVGSGTALRAGRSRDRFPEGVIGHWDFSLIFFFRLHYDFGGRLKR